MSVSRIFDEDCSYCASRLARDVRYMNSNKQTLIECLLVNALVA